MAPDPISQVSNVCSIYGCNYFEYHSHNWKSLNVISQNQANMENKQYAKTNYVMDSPK